MLFKGALYFNFRGRSSEFHNYALVQIGNNSESSIYGLNRSVNEEEGLGDLSVFKGFKNEYVEFSLTIAKMSKSGSPLRMTREDEFELKRWFFATDNYETLTVNGIEYKVACLGAEDNIKYDKYRMGYINFKFRCLPYAFSPTINNTYRVITTKDIEIDNKTNVIDNTYPIITFKLNSGNSIKIINKSNRGETMLLTNLNPNIEYEIDTFQKQIYNKSDYREDLYSKNVSKEWISFIYGINRLKIECENGIINIKYKPKLCL